MLALAAPLSAAVTVPYSTDFSDSTVGASQPLGWNAATGGGSSEITAGGQFLMDAQGVGSRITLFDPSPVIDRTAGQGFRMSASFNLSTGTGQYENTSIHFLANGSGSPRIIMNGGYENSGSFELHGMSSVSNGNIGATNFTNLETAGALFTIEVTGIFQSDGSLDVTAFISNNLDANTATATGTWDSPAAANGFGIRTAAGGGGSGHFSTATYHSFSLEAIPEPSALVLSLGALGVFLKRRRS